MQHKSPNLLYYVGLFLASSAALYFLILISAALWSWFIAPLMFILWLVAPALIVAFLFIRDHRRKPGAGELYILAMVCTICALMIPLAGQFFITYFWFTNSATSTLYAATISSWFWAGIIMLACISYYWFLIFIWGWIFMRLARE